LHLLEEFEKQNPGEYPSHSGRKKVKKCQQAWHRHGITSFEMSAGVLHGESKPTTTL